MTFLWFGLYGVGVSVISLIPLPHGLLVAWLRAALGWAGGVIMLWHYVVVDAIQLAFTIIDGTPASIPVLTTTGDMYAVMWGILVLGYLNVADTHRANTAPHAIRSAYRNLF